MIATRTELPAPTHHLFLLLTVHCYYYCCSLSTITVNVHCCCPLSTVAVSVCLRLPSQSLFTIIVVCTIAICVITIPRQPTAPWIFLLSSFYCLLSMSEKMVTIVICCSPLSLLSTATIIVTVCHLIFLTLVVTILLSS